MTQHPALLSKSRSPRVVWVCLVVMLVWGGSCEAEETGTLSEALVIVDTGTGKGSGFLCLLEGTNYVVTNTHVLEGARQYTLRTLDGRKLKPLRLELADHGDLARIEVNLEGMQALKTTSNPPRIGDVIQVLGNSMGAGVVTELTGKVQGVGPDQLEVTAPFVPGNSGSPIINRSGKVLAVATYVARNQDDNWTLEGSRFAETRRFGMRLREGLKWVRISPKQFYLQSMALRDATRFAEDVSLALEASHSREPERTLQQVRGQLGLNRPKGKGRYHDPDYPKLVDDFCEHFIKFAQASREGSERSYPVRLHRDGYMEALKRIPELPQEKMQKIRWATEHYYRQAAKLQDLYQEWYDSIAHLKNKNFF